MHARRSLCLVGIMLLGLVAGCSREEPTGPETANPMFSPQGPPLGLGEVQAALRQLALGLSRAAQNPEARALIRQALQASLYDHKAYFNQFVQQNPALLLEPIRAAMATDAPGLVRLLNALPQVELAMPAHLDIWDGTQVPYVLHHAGPEFVETLDAFDEAGNPITLDGKTPPAYPTLVVLPAEVNFSVPPRLPGLVTIPRVIRTPLSLTGLDLAKKDDLRGKDRGLPDGPNFITCDAADPNCGGGGGGGGDPQPYYATGIIIHGTFEGWFMGDPEIVSLANFSFSGLLDHPTIPPAGTTGIDYEEPTCANVDTPNLFYLTAYHLCNQLNQDPNQVQMDVFVYENDCGARLIFDSFGDSCDPVGNPNEDDELGSHRFIDMRVHYTDRLDLYFQRDPNRINGGMIFAP